MIYIERNIKIRKNEAQIEEPIVLYKGDMNIELQFTIENNPFKYRTGTAVTYGQLVIRRPEAAPIFSEPVKMSSSKVLFTVSGDMIDELEELGEYDFQIQLLNNEQTSRGSLPPVYGGIIIRDPLCEGAATNRAAVNSRSTFVMRATNNNEGEAFDDKGNYNKTNWVSGDIITDSRLNKVETALYTINDNVTSEYASRDFVTDMIDANNNSMDDKYMKAEALDNYATKEEVTESINGIVGDYATQDYVNDMISNIEVPDINLDDYATKEEINTAISNIELTPGPQGEPGPEGPMGPQGPAGKDAEAVDLTGYATKDELQTALGDIESLLGGI